MLITINKRNASPPVFPLVSKVLFRNEEEKNILSYFDSCFIPSNEFNFSYFSKHFYKLSKLEV